MSKADDAAALARRKAQELLDRTKHRDDERIASREKQRQAEAAKTARLRELRLAKEASEEADKQSIKHERTVRSRGQR